MTIMIDIYAWLSDSNNLITQKTKKKIFNRILVKIKKKHILEKKSNAVLYCKGVLKVHIIQKWQL